MGELGRLLLLLFPAQGVGVLCIGAGRWAGVQSMGGVKGAQQNWEKDGGQLELLGGPF